MWMEIHSPGGPPPTPRWKASSTLSSQPAATESWARSRGLRAGFHLAVGLSMLRLLRRSAAASSLLRRGRAGAAAVARRLRGRSLGRVGTRREGRPVGADVRCSGPRHARGGAGDAAGPRARPGRRRRPDRHHRGEAAVRRPGRRHRVRPRPGEDISRRTSVRRVSSPCSSCPTSTSACGTASWPWSPALAWPRTSTRWTGSPTSRSRSRGATSTCGWLVYRYDPVTASRRRPRTTPTSCGARTTRTPVRG
jgi:hypothetical protein